jgi:hypothetical protein
MLRRGQTEHIRALYEKGEIYINTIDLIRKYDDNPERSDPFDSMAYREYMGDCNIEISVVNNTLNTKTIFFEGENSVSNYDSLEKGNIYCFEGVYQEDFDNDEEHIVHDTHTLGEAIIIIHDPKEFINRVKNGLQKKGYNAKFCWVDYYTINYTGKLTPFWKHERFKTQKECRFYVSNSKNEIITFNIGCLSDIAEYFEKEVMFKLPLTDGRIKYINVPVETR